mgnify:CR=1 FL=1
MFDSNNLVLDMSMTAPEQPDDSGFYGAHDLTLVSSLPEHPTAPQKTTQLGLLLLPSCTSGNKLDTVVLEDMTIPILGGATFQFLPEILSFAD